MSLKEKIDADLKTAMLQKNEAAKGALRGLKLAIAKAETEKNAGEMTDDKIIALVTKQVAQRVESADIYKTQNRQDLADVELGEIAVLKTYLPEQVDETEVIGIVKSVVHEVEAVSKKDMGKVMNNAKIAGLAGKFDKKRLATIIQSFLS